MRAALPLREFDADVSLAALAAGSLGIGLVLALAGAGQHAPSLLLVGAAAATCGLLVLVSAGWIDALLIVVLVLSAPAPYSSDALRIAPAAAATALAICAWLLRSTVDRRPLDTGLLPVRAAAALLTAVLLAALFAQARGPAFREVVNWLLLLALLVIAADHLAMRPERRRGIALAIAGVMAATGLVATLQFTGVLPSRFRWGAGVVRATAGFGWPNELGMFLALGVPFAAYAVTTARGRAMSGLAAAGLAATLAGLAATFSRGSWVAVLLGSLLLLLVGRKRLVLRIWVAGALALVLSNAATGGAITSRVASTGTDWVIGQRLALTLSGVNMFVDHPLLGVGPGGFGDSLQGFAAQLSQLWDLTGSAQNAYVQFAAEMGAFGLAAFLWFLAASYVRALRSARAAALAASLRSDRAAALAVPPRSASSAVLDPRADRELALRSALLWSLSILWCIGMFEWPFAHGVAELIMVVIALALARP